MEIFFVADEHVGQRRDLAECLGKRILAAFPERRAVIEIERNERTVLLRGLCQRKAAFRRLVAHGCNQAGQVENADTLLPEDTLDIKIFDRKCPTNFTSTVIPETRCAQPKAGIRNVELVPIAPRPALFDIQPLKADVPCAELPLDEVGNGAVLDKFGQHEALPPKARRDIQHV